MKTFSYLALGDSYTIGEQVPVFESFPYQTVQLMRSARLRELNNDNKSAKYNYSAAEILAKTGWTTDELSAAVDTTLFSRRYDMVSLLIGVNNQYRGRPLENFYSEFRSLLAKAIQLAGGRSKKVCVLSIPDWGVTPFAKERDVKKIAFEIDAFNEVCRSSAADLKTGYLDITNTQRTHGDQPEYLAVDGLHPSGKEYEVWATQLFRYYEEINADTNEV